MTDAGIRVGVLGPPVVRTAQGELVPLPGRLVGRLLVLLVLARGREITRDRLLDELWGDQAPTNPVNALQALVSRIRKLAPGVNVRSGPVGYRLPIAAAEVDAWRFEELAVRGRAELAREPARAAATLREALGLWRGDLPGGVGPAHAASARLRELRRGALSDRIEADLRLGEARALVSELEQLAAAEPTFERWRVLLMRALHACDRRAEALQVYAAARATLADELGVDPSDELEQAHLTVLRATAAPQAAEEPAGAVGAPFVGGNLPRPLTALLGRDHELTLLARVLAESRLVTVVGPGGVGKTRLAVEAGRRAAEWFADGAWLVDLSGATDPTRVADALLDALGAQGPSVLGGAATPVGTPVERIVAALGRRRTLLVLDNCEHQIDAVADLVETVLGACADVSVLATSREPLAVPGERSMPLEPLDCPEPDGPETDGVAVADNAAARLFVERAVAVNPGFTLSADNAPAVARICRVLDGLPLAIELAASRLRALSVAQVAERLEDRFRLLVGGRRAQPARHQTLHAVVTWSWDLLDEDERALAMLLSVFTGGATLEAVESVCSTHPVGVPAGRVLDLLTALVDKSLVTPHDSRYRMLGTIREYLTQRLAESGQETAVRRAHADHFRSAAETAAPQLLGGGQVEWLAALRAEHDNLLAALDFTIEKGEADASVRLVAALGWYWFLCGYHGEAAGWAERALAVPGPCGLSARALVTIMSALTPAAGPDGAAAILDRVRQGMELAGQARLAGEPERLELAVIASVFDGDPSTALASMSRLTTAADPWVRACGHLNCGHWQATWGQGEQAAEHFTAALEESRSIGERWGQVQALSALARIAGGTGDAASAVPMLAEALGLAVELGSRRDEITVRAWLGVELAHSGDLTAARAELTAALTTAGRIGAVQVMPSVRVQLAEVARLQGDLLTARSMLDTALAECLDGVVPDIGQLTLTLCGRGHLDVTEGRLDDARSRHAQSVRHVLLLNDPQLAGSVVKLAADIAWAEDDPDRAATLLGLTTALTGAPDHADPDRARISAACRTALGDDVFRDVYHRGVALWRDAAAAGLAGVLALPTA